MTNRANEPRNAMNLLRNEEKFLSIKQRLRLIDFQISVFNNAIKKQERQYESYRSEERVEKRKKAFGLKYESRQQLDQDYMIGAISDAEYSKQRYALWLVYSDRGYEMKLKWLYEQRDYYLKQKKTIEKWMEKQRKESKRNINKRYIAKLKHRETAKHVERKKRALQRAEDEKRKNNILTEN